ncbi:MAG: hypothetical protein UY16_C0010G0019 [Candidatus Gottesmanbacteria bacterium GW2011_GWA2_47_9]|uniref:Uncharacterized protein n=1 Tax=Candidatus Gottesmanbacteria bacterium GW2011_GWA2_47_9 TaxID=1618445 RepID=A0A0G1WD41_9BACT|nr:MAG: hypothetical protein UY16_C0010G0019 [Candidatus Gottesmanbacteria bacterium GW2011_GWA2_47_9]
MEEQPTPQPVATQPSPSSPVPIKQNSKPLTKAAVPVFLFMAGGLAYLGYQNYQLQQQLNSLLEQKTNQTISFSTPASSSGLTSSPDPSISWTKITANSSTTYTNELYRFSFTIPSSLKTTVENPEGCGISGPSNNKLFQLICISNSKSFGQGNDAPFDGFSVYVDSNQDGISLTNYVQQEIDAKKSRGYGENGTTKQFQLAELKGITLVGYNWPGIETSYVKFPNTNDKRILILSKIEESSGSFDQIFNRVLSTFGFQD